MGNAASVNKGTAQDNENLVNKILAAKIRNPDNLMAKHFTEHYLGTLSQEKQQRLLKICKSGGDNYDSSLGMYAQQPNDYDEFFEYFDKVIYN
jgi:hypothetical protein